MRATIWVLILSGSNCTKINKLKYKNNYKVGLFETNRTVRKKKKKKNLIKAKKAKICIKTVSLWWNLAMQKPNQPIVLIYLFSIWEKIIK